MNRQEVISLIAGWGFVLVGLVGLFFRATSDRWLVWSAGYTCLCVFSLFAAPVTRTIPAFLLLVCLVCMTTALGWLKLRQLRSEKEG